MENIDRIKGCLLGGAVGDALGAAVEFQDWPEIKREFGPAGIQDFQPTFGVLGAITDDTQMMLFTAEGLLRAFVRSTARGISSPPGVIHHSLMRWLLTQGGEAAMEVGRDGWLIQEKALWSRRAPGLTCLSALSASQHFGMEAVNNSKGCGGVMRVAPHAFFDSAFDLAAANARLTHGHPAGYQAAGIFADILQRLTDGQCSLEQAVTESLAENAERPAMSETTAIIERVLKLHRDDIKPTPHAIEEIGGGWVAEEALAIGLWCALMAESFEQGVIWAVNHSGDSDSTGLIAGNLLGIQLGVRSIPDRWLDKLELREVIEKMAEDIEWVPKTYNTEDEPSDAQIWERYPGW